MLGRRGRRHPNDRAGVDSMTLQTRAQCSFGHARDRATAGEGRQMQMATKLKRWTLEEVHRLPDDGNKYELVRGDLFVTPPPTDDHETIAARLAKALTPYVEAQRLGLVYRPRAVLRFEDSDVAAQAHGVGTRAAADLDRRSLLRFDAPERHDRQTTTLRRRSHRRVLDGGP
jgi:hypothetical protein